MNRKQLISGLRELAEVLKPFIHESHSGERVWNGTAYVVAEPKHMDPYALAWWSTLRTAASLLETSGRELSDTQTEYLHRQLFGGMGSLSDFQVDVRRFGDEARSANQRLDQKLDEVFRLFNHAASD